MSDPAPQITVWTETDGVSRSRSGACVALAAGEVVVVAARRGRVVGQLLVAKACSARVRVAGLVVGAGMHALRHGERVEVGASAHYVAGDGVPIERTYDPSSDGADQRCLRTKVRLTPGEPITVCPGTATVPCGGLFRRAAWSPALPCHACGFDPAARRWRPPASARADGLRRLLALGGHHARR